MTRFVYLPAVPRRKIFPYYGIDEAAWWCLGYQSVDKLARGQDRGLSALVLKGPREFIHRLISIRDELLRPTSAMTGEGGAEGGGESNQSFAVMVTARDGLMSRRPAGAVGSRVRNAAKKVAPTRPALSGMAT